MYTQKDILRGKLIPVGDSENWASFVKKENDSNNQIKFCQKYCRLIKNHDTEIEYSRWFSGDVEEITRLFVKHEYKVPNPTEINETSIDMFPMPAKTTEGGITFKECQVNPSLSIMYLFIEKSDTTGFLVQPHVNHRHAGILAVRGNARSLGHAIYCPEAMAEGVDFDKGGNPMSYIPYEVVDSTSRLLVPLQNTMTIQSLKDTRCINRMSVGNYRCQIISKIGFEKTLNLFGIKMEGLEGCSNINLRKVQLFLSFLAQYKLETNADIVNFIRERQLPLCIDCKTTVNVNRRILRQFVLDMCPFRLGCYEGQHRLTAALFALEGTQVDTYYPLFSVKEPYDPKPPSNSVVFRPQNQVLTFLAGDNITPHICSVLRAYGERLTTKTGLNLPSTLADKVPGLCQKLIDRYTDPISNSLALEATSMKDWQDVHGRKKDIAEYVLAWALRGDGGETYKAMYLSNGGETKGGEEWIAGMVSKITTHGDVFTTGHRKQAAYKTILKYPAQIAYVLSFCYDEDCSDAIDRYFSCTSFSYLQTDGFQRMSLDAHSNMEFMSRAIITTLESLETLLTHKFLSVWNLKRPVDFDSKRFQKKKLGFFIKRNVFLDIIRTIMYYGTHPDMAKPGNYQHEVMGQKFKYYAGGKENQVKCPMEWLLVGYYYYIQALLAFHEKALPPGLESIVYQPSMASGGKGFPGNINIYGLPNNSFSIFCHSIIEDGFEFSTSVFYNLQYEEKNTASVTFTKANQKIHEHISETDDDNISRRWKDRMKYLKFTVDTKALATLEKNKSDEAKKAYQWFVKKWGDSKEDEDNESDEGEGGPKSKKSQSGIHIFDVMPEADPCQKFYYDYADGKYMTLKIYRDNQERKQRLSKICDERSTFGKHFFKQWIQHKDPMPTVIDLMKQVQGIAQEKCAILWT